MSTGRMKAMWDELSTVPAVFTLEVLEFLSDERMKIVKSTLENEAEALEQSAEKYAQDDEELLQTLNLLTWLEFKIGSKEKALELNNKALALTNNKEYFSLGNRAHLMWCGGDLEQTRSCLDSLAKVKVNGSSGEESAFVKANQAYCYFRLGGRANLLQAVTLYEEALRIKPYSYLWRYQAGIANRRSSNPHMQTKNMPYDADGRRKMKNLAKDYFERVADKSTNPRLRAYAYSELAQLVSHDKVTGLCDKALSTFSNELFVILNCSKALKRIGNVSQAFEILNQSHDARSNSQSLHVIGDCLQKMAEKEGSESKREDLYNKAQLSYRDAILKNSLNLPTYFTLAKLLATRHNYREALVEFRKFFNTVRSIEETSYALLQMNAYEQAALCQLELCHDPAYIRELSHPVTEESLRKDAEGMLLKALEIGFNIFRPKEGKKYLYRSLQTLVRLGEERDTPEALQLLSRVYQLVNEKEKTLQVLKRLVDVMFQDPEAIIFALKTYINVKSYDEAYALLQMSRVQLEPCHFDWDLFTRVTLLAAWKHLGQLTSQTAAARIFKDQFDNHRQQDRYSNTLTQPSEGDEVTTEQEHLDVLIIYDDSRDRSKGESKLSNICRKLQQAMATVFGLNVGHNMQACCAGGPVAALQLKEMKKAQVILVLVDEEPMDGFFSSLLNYLPTVMEQREDNPRPPRVLVAQTNARVKVPTALSSFPKAPSIESTIVSFETLEQMCDRGEVISSSGDPELADDTARMCVEDIMVFFCCLIFTDWPLSQNVAV